MPKQVIIKLKGVRCVRCRHLWVPRKGTPLRCASCKSPYWDKPRRRKKAVA